MNLKNLHQIAELVKQGKSIEEAKPLVENTLLKKKVASLEERVSTLEKELQLLRRQTLKEFINTRRTIINKVRDVVPLEQPKKVVRLNESQYQ